MMLSTFLGLPYIRISPDHGPATDLIGKIRVIQSASIIV